MGGGGGVSWTSNFPQQISLSEYKPPQKQEVEATYNHAFFLFCAHKNIMRCLASSVETRSYSRAVTDKLLCTVT